ncbi:MAG: hypothetical protein ACKO6D_05740 [Rubrivivax sp.]
MNRCAHGLAALAAACLLAGPAPAAAQAPAHRNFPPTALRGELVLDTHPQASLNGGPARLAPGARIRGPDNLLQLPAALAGQRLLVHYTLEPTTGLLLEVWVLNPAERAREPWPATPEQARAWRFDPSAQTWTRP